MTVAGSPCRVDLHAKPKSIHPGARVILRRAPGCDRDNARQLTVYLSKRGGRRLVGTATLESDGGVVGKVVIPAATPNGLLYLSLGEKTGCDDTASCAGSPVSVAVRVR
jgi:hypothetical protein